jgi:hypothetical protein
MAAGLITTIAIQPYMAYTWYILVGSAVTFVVGLIAGIFNRAEKTAPVLSGPAVPE